MTSLIKLREPNQGKWIWINPERIEMIMHAANDNYYIYCGAEPLQWAFIDQEGLDILLQYVDVVNEAIAREPLTTLAD